MKKGFKPNLMVKFILMSVVPLLVLFILAEAAISLVATQIAERLVNNMLSSNVYMMDYILSSQAGGGGGEGEMPEGELSEEEMAQMEAQGQGGEQGGGNDNEMQLIMQDMKEHTGGVNFALINGGNIIISTFTIDAAVDTERVQKAIEQGSLFVANDVAGGSKYYTYYQAVGQNGDMVIQATIGHNTIKEYYSSYLMTATIAMMIVALLAIVSVVLIVRRVVKAIAATVKNLDSVADGTLRFELPEKATSRSDEVGNIARSIQSLVDKFSKTIRQINGSTDDLTGFSNQFREQFDKINSQIDGVNRAVDEIAHGATNQASETTKLAQSMNDMGDALDQASVDQLSESTEEMRKQNQLMSDILDELSEISARTEKSIANVYEQTADTNRSAEEIHHVVDMISEIAGQTNLLSLNASIEAARAGEQGKGFAVVADEVRNLAEQSADSAQKIGQIVDQLIQKSNISVKTMEEVRKEIGNQNEKLAVTRDTFSALEKEIQSVSGEIDNVQSQVSALSETKTIVMDGLDGLSAIAEENAASTEETAASMVELEQIVGECSEATGKLVDMAGDMETNVKLFRFD